MGGGTRATVALSIYCRARSTLEYTRDEWIGRCGSGRTTRDSRSEYRHCTKHEVDVNGNKLAAVLTAKCHWLDPSLSRMN